MLPVVKVELGEAQSGEDGKDGREIFQEQDFRTGNLAKHDSGKDPEADIVRKGVQLPAEIRAGLQETRGEAVAKICRRGTEHQQEA